MINSLTPPRTLWLIFFLCPLLNYAQVRDPLQTIDSIVMAIDYDPNLVKKIFDTTSYEKKDGGKEWDSLYVHKQYFYAGDQLVKIVGWKTYGIIRQDLLIYYHQGKLIKYAEGESYKTWPGYGLLNFEVYYHNDKDIGVIWLTPKPPNVIGVGSDTYREIAYYLHDNVKAK